MILDREYLWRQLNGPQITSFSNAIKKYHKDSYDEKLEMFDNISIDNSDAGIIRFLGSLMLFPSPVIIEANEYDDWFRFSRVAKNPNPPEGDGRTVDPPPKAKYGFGDVQGSGIGGMFPLSDYDTEGKIELPDAEYRELLQEIARIDGFTGSGLQAIDFIADVLLRKTDGTKVYYELSYYDMGIPDVNYGDILITIKENIEYQILIFKLLINSIFQSQPVVYINIDPTIGD